MNGQTRFPKPPIEVFIDDQILEFDISKDFGVLNILIEDVSGNIVFNSSIEGCGRSIPLELDLKKGTYIIIVLSDEYKLWGKMCIRDSLMSCRAFLYPRQLLLL